ncbi:hypothetical protein N0B31_17760 [Salinirubellus salinus]|uniref:Uncharacterized protein n=1 Tax=Salinirubellus salinus TaxID=1364945 RepID=A0A9E7UAN0_9EURY|nr:hypothetical protein [Salinirubellus salinus]UWM53959.1 hypothetical protein N0B31_17760 [Salinirubellus salinus]
MTRLVSIDVVCDRAESGGTEVFGVVTEHRPDLPKPFDEELQRWVRSTFSGELEEGQSLSEAAEMEYEPEGEIVDIRKKA